MQFGRRLQSAQFGEYNSDESPSYSNPEPRSDKDVSHKLDVSDLALQILFYRNCSTKGSQMGGGKNE